MKLLSILLAVFSTTALFSETVAPNVSSSKASFDGEKLHLEGKVELKHPLGILKASQADLVRGDSKIDFPFSVIELINEVQLELSSKALLLCERARMDFNELHGTMENDSSSGVIYREEIAQSKGKQILEIKSAKADFDLKKIQNELVIDRLYSTTGVEITMGPLLKATAAFGRLEQAYSKTPQLFLESSPEQKCQIWHHQDDLLADQVEYDLSANEVYLQGVNGNLKVNQDNPLASQIKVSSPQIILHREKNSADLMGDSRIEDPAFGIVESKEKLSLFRKATKTGYALQQIKATGPFRLTYHTNDKNAVQRFTSAGTFEWDAQKLVAKAQAPKKTGDSVQQLLYEESRMGVFADTASFEYTFHEDHFTPLQVSMKGNVRLFSSDLNKPRIALCDRISFSPSTRTFILASNPGQKVILWDAEQQIEMKAQEIHITEDPDHSSKELIKGVGVVEFHLSRDELELLQKYMPTHANPLAPR